MPFDNMGRFVAPQASMSMTPTAPQQPLAQTSQQNMIQARPAMQTMQAQQAYRPQLAAQNYMPLMNTSGGFPGHFNDRVNQNNKMFDPGFLNNQPPNPNNPNPSVPQTPPTPQPPQQAIAPSGPPPGPQFYQQYGMSQLGAPSFQPQQGGPSVTQMAGRGNAQSVSNYLQALQQSGQASNNANMNAPGQLGAGAQAGFAGFGVNGQQAYANPVMAGGAYNPGVQYQTNMAYAGPNYNVGNYAQQGAYGQQAAPRLANQGGVTAGGTGGVNGQPQWQTPQPWGSDQNNPPGAAGSLWGGGSSQDWQNYFNASPGQLPPGYQQQPGAFYSSNPNQPQGGAVTSDVNAKTNIAPAEAELEEFLDALGVYSYEYKDPKYGEGRRISPMAQDIEKTPLGAAAISTNAEGYKQVDYGKLAGTQMAALALLNHKYKKLEADLKDAISTNLKNRKK